MTNIEAILAFMRHRSNSLDDWAWAYENSTDPDKDEAECKARAEILRAQSRTIADLVKEIEDAMNLDAKASRSVGPDGDWRRVVVSEMTGPMDAVILRDPSIEVVHGHTAEDHEALLEPGEGQLQVGWALVPPREMPADGASAPFVDIRYALVTYLSGGFSASIYNSLAEAEAEEAEFAEEHNAFVVDHNNSIAMCTVQLILIPRRELAGQMAPTIYRA